MFTARKMLIWILIIMVRYLAIQFHLYFVYIKVQLEFLFHRVILGSENAAPGEEEVVALPVEEVAPPVNNKRTERGIVVFNNLVLTAPPPMYRPFAMIDSLKVKEKSGTKSKDPGMIYFVGEIYLNVLSLLAGEKCECNIKVEISNYIVGVYIFR